jgi:hypothetical protein
MLFGQFANSQSLPHISNELRSAIGNLNHLGILRAPSKSALSYQKKKKLRIFSSKNYLANNPKVQNLLREIKTVKIVIIQFLKYLMQIKFLPN